jgi:tetratricopeptide (TPR) repeat protein
LFVVAGSFPVSAQTQQQFDWCVNKGDAYTPDLAINTCTASIQSGRWSGQGLAWAYYNRGRAYAAKGDNDRAIADYNAALRLDPKFAFAYDNQGNAYHAKGDYHRAIADHNEALRLDPNFAHAYYNRGSAYAAKGDLDRAIADYNEAIELDSKYAAAYNGRCWARALTGRDLAQALADCNEALRLQPDDANTLNSPGLVQFKLSAFDRAITDYGPAIAKNAKDADSLYGRGVAKLRGGDTAGGEADIAAAKAITADIATIYAGYGVK